jgi:hypothetical protein
MTITCPSSVKACAMRLTRLNDCSIALDPLTPNSRIATNGFMEINLSPDVEAGEDITVKNACGDICVRDKDCDRLKGYDVEIKLCGVPLPVIEMLLGYTLLADVNGNFSGFASRESKASPCVEPTMVEFWSKNANKGACTVDGTASDLFLHWVLPTTNNWEISGGLNFTMGNLEITITGYAENNPLFFPSFPGPTFPSWTPGGGDPAGVPTGSPPPVLPPDVEADPWTLTDQAAIQDGGPIHMKAVAALPTVDACNYIETFISSS